MAEGHATGGDGAADRPPTLDGLDHVSVPCRDLDEGIRFYRDVLGGRVVVQEPAFALFEIAGAHIGIGSAGCTFMDPGNEYPHIGLTCSAEALVRMRGGWRGAASRQATSGRARASRR